MNRLFIFSTFLAASLEHAERLDQRLSPADSGYYEGQHRDDHGFWRLHVIF